MPPAKASGKAITKELANVVRETYNSPKRDELTVNYARQIVEDRLGLEDGFLKEGEWKATSKQIIIDTLNELETADEHSGRGPTPRKEAQSGRKQSKRENNKRAQKASTPSSNAESGAEDLSDVEGRSMPPAKKRKLVKRSKKSQVLSESDDDDSGPSDQEPPRPQVKRQPKQPIADASELSNASDDSSGGKPSSGKREAAIPAGDDESELSEVIDDPLKPKQKKKTKPTTEPKPSSAPVADDSSSELSSVIDEPPPPKRKRKANKATGKDDTSAPSKRSKTAAAASADSTEEAQIKLLQSQLKKCGVNKVWAFEFKKHGIDTPKAKIRHLKQMLVDVGMTGRFSEARAREIKEMRELQADLQDVMQGEKSWGVGGGGRGARRRAAVAGQARTRARKQDDESEESDDGGEGESSGEKSESSEESDEEGGMPAVRKKGPTGQRAALAFLDDESESD
ncbi:hypothetical protein P885DRAFT_82245 [Corynascus similis CBS 632.67]